jgi:hypothetical protein
VARIPIELAERYRRRAEELRTLAGELRDADVKAALLYAAEGYDEMARAVERAAKGDPGEAE